MKKEMRTLVVGAGAIGGYFGGRLLEANRDVTFLVRPRRAEQLSRSGLRIRSRLGDATIPSPRTVLADQLHETFDVVLLSCKAYDLQGAIASFAPAVGSETAILPLLNGMRHLDTLDERFGPDRVLGGHCLIAAALNEEGEIHHLNDTHELSFGERNGAMSRRIHEIAAMMQPAGFKAHVSTDIVSGMWRKWVFLSALASSTCLMRASIGDICKVEHGGDLILGAFEECQEVADAEGYPVQEEFARLTLDMLTARDSTLTASMLRDIERNAPIEADHIIGDLLARGAQNDLDPLILKMAYCHLKAYEARRNRLAIHSSGA